MKKRFGRRARENLYLSFFLFLLFHGAYTGPAQAAPGSLDLDFGLQGLVITNFPGSPGTNSASAVAIQSDGKIVAAGFSHTNGSDDFALARYNTDGSLDATFNPSGPIPGLVTTDFSGSGSFDRASAVAIQSDGKIVAAGVSNTNGSDDFALARYNTDGTLDATFNPSGPTPGLVVTDVSDSDNPDQANAVAIQSDGKIVAAGTSMVGGESVFALARYDTGGILDATFNPAGSLPGTVTTDVSDSDVGNGVAIQSDGKIVVAGTSTVGGESVFALARYDTGGILDATFNPAGSLPGTVMTDVSGSGGGDRAHAVAIQSDGKIVVVGASFVGSPDDFALARYDTGGTLDATFNPAGSLPGTVTTDVSGTDGGDEANAVAIQSDGKIVAAGGASSGNFDFAVARYDADGTLDTAFGSFGPTPGFVVMDFSGVANDDEANAVTIQSDGKIVAAGFSGFSGGGAAFAVVRYQGNTADLSILKTASTTSAEVGEEVTYTITIQNNGPQSADGVVVTDVLTGSVSFGSINASQGTCSGTNELTCDLGTLASGAGATVTVSVTTTAAGGISNIAKVTGQAVDPDPTNNLALAFVNVSGGSGPAPSSADLSITKTADSTSPAVGETVTYTLTVTNHGPDSATGVVVTDVPFGVFGDLSAGSSQGTCTVSDSVTCDLGTLASGADATLTVTLTAGGFGLLSNLATVVSQVSDPNLGNNHASANLSVTDGNVSGGGCRLNISDGLGDLSKTAWPFALAGLTALVLRLRARRRV
jgi:uncharacterized delta-60 repeat protein/uncharacterized repeat protein (TIGR01451 family)